MVNGCIRGRRDGMYRRRTGDRSRKSNVWWLVSAESTSDVVRQLQKDADQRRAWVAEWSRGVEAGVEQADFDRLWRSVLSLCDPRNIVACNRVRVDPRRSVVLTLVLDPHRTRSEIQGLDLAHHVCVRRSKWNRATLDDAHSLIEDLGDHNVKEIRESITSTGDLRFDVKLTSPLIKQTMTRIAKYPEGLFVIEQPHDFAD